MEQPEEIVICPSCGIEFDARHIAGMRTCPVCGARFDGEQPQIAKKTSPKVWVTLGVIVLIILVFSLFKYEPKTQTNLTNVINNARNDLKNEAVNSISVDINRDDTSNKSILILNIYIKNNSDTKLKDPVIACVSKSATGSVLDVKKFTIYEYLGPHGRIVKRSMNLGFINSQGTDVQCKCIDATYNGDI